MTTISLRIQGMTCGGCSSRIERRLASAPGVTSAKVDLASTIGEFTFDETKIDTAEIKRIIGVLGFGAGEVE
ncbi:MAG: heavy-metal-associated domain-containing protein [bacterium]